MKQSTETVQDQMPEADLRFEIWNLKSPSINPLSEEYSPGSIKILIH